MSDTVLLTGITGFIGGHIAQELLRAGYSVRGSLRNPARADTVRDALAAAGTDISHLSFVTLDLLKDDGWAGAVEDARYVIHSASPFVTAMPKDPLELIRPAVEGTERALNAALAAGVERIVLTSSMVAILDGHGADGPARFTAADWSDLESGRMNAYAQSKTRAERRAWEIVEQAGRRDALAVINPGLVLGPMLDDDPGTSGALVQRLLKGSVPAAPDMWLPVVDVRDLARIHVAALSDPAAGGRRHVAAFGDASLMDMGQALKAAFPAYGRKMPRFVMPNWMVRIYALFDADARSTLEGLGHRPKFEANSGYLLGRDPIAVDQAIVATGQSLIERRLV